jgi:hypothetical protein
MRTLFYLPVLTVSLASMACASEGGGTSSLPDSGGDAHTGHDAARVHDAAPRDSAADEAQPDAEGDSGDAGAAPDAPSPFCPASPPAQYSSCASSAEYACSWGTDPRFDCRTIAFCGIPEDPDGGPDGGFTGPVWVVQNLGCPTPPPDCPSAPPPYPDAGGLVDLPPCEAAQAGLECTYGGDAYTCAPCPGPTLCLRGSDGGIPYHWYRTTLASGCPKGDPGGTLPNWGAACSDPGLLCDYNPCASTEDGAAPWASGVGLSCQSDGTWGPGSSGVCL